MRVTTLSMRELVDQLIQHVFEGTKTKHVVTANAQFYVLAERDARFRKCLAEADYVCADGLPIVRMCNWMGAIDAERITGVDLIPLLCERAAEFDLPVYLLGGYPGSAAASASLLMDRFPKLRVCGVGCPPKGFEESPEVLTKVLRSIAQAEPSIIFIALGAPKQEYFIQQHIRTLGIPIAIGVGGSFELLAGVRKRAPQWAQVAGMEWAFRLAQEPRRLAKRYLVGNSVFSYYALRYLLSEEALETRDAYRGAQTESEAMEQQPAGRTREVG
ncbi:MAG: N-acetylglucosaminyldiphosphoundecaprenol N-acetyl-beta-D-mannosaminyltransferase [Acidobacteriaceae bacterium]|jgi:N-acetylglucosaminyldiphosphoundecaprenol N-acetyl-beta-D-mannosaminyltransferase|nr:N-acetylglucosaminyldiphosphoundecaprenol N-acetyl-beta-D-mannosaminyltransferase [Acidobacteriaceae bacterium]